jgi:hypothetical protein
LQLVAEFSRRGITEKKARALLANLKPGQDGLRYRTAATPTGETAAPADRRRATVRENWGTGSLPGGDCRRIRPELTSKRRGESGQRSPAYCARAEAPGFLLRSCFTEVAHHASGRERVKLQIVDIALKLR